MTNDEVEKQTIQNTIAIAELTEIVKQISIDADRVIGKINDLASVISRIQHLEVRVQNQEEEAKLGIRPATLKNILKSLVAALVTFGVWVTVQIYEIKENQVTHRAVQHEHEKSEGSILDSVEKRLNKIENYQGRNREKINANSRQLRGK